MSKIIDNILFVPGKRRPAPMDRHREDRRWLTVCIVLFFAAHLIVWGMDEAAYRAAEADKPPVELTWEAPLDQPQLLEAITLQLEPAPYWEDVPLDRELQAVLWEACEEHGVPVSLALGLIGERLPGGCSQQRGGLWPVPAQPPVLPGGPGPRRKHHRRGRLAGRIAGAARGRSSGPACL